MKYTTAILGAAVGANAHYFFDVSVVDGVASSSFQYIRSFTRPTAYNPIKFSSNPPEDIRDNSLADGEDIICNQGAFAAAGQTDVLTVDAGAEVTVKLGVSAKMEHPGPGLVYMSRAPSDDVKSYDGTGDWFKIFQEGVCDTAADFTKDAWCTWGRDTMTATIPADTPAGEYLMRFEHIGVHRSHVNQPEHYVSCVQVKVENGGTGTPGPLAQFPGAYTDADEYANFSIYGGLKDFPFPGPAVWEGGSGGTVPTPPANDNGNQETETPETETPETEAPETPESETPCGETPSDDSSADDAPAEDAPAATCAGIFAQCGGKNWDGPTCCSAGSCRASNDWYSQCV